MPVLRTVVVVALVCAAVVAAPAQAAVGGIASVAATSTDLGPLGGVRIKAWSCDGPLGRWQLKLTHVGGWKGSGTASWTFSATAPRATIDGSYPLLIPVPGIDGVRLSYTGSVALERRTLHLRLELSWSGPSGVRSRTHVLAARVPVRSGAVRSCLPAPTRAQPAAIA